MTSPVPAYSTEAASAAYLAALTSIGVGTIEEALALWQEVPVTRIEETRDTWLEKAIAMILSRRSMSRDLGVAYYRLMRALTTGRTTPDPREPEKRYVTMAELRSEFSRLTDKASAGPQRDAAGPAEPSRNDSTPAPQKPSQPPRPEPAQPKPDQVSSDAEADRILVEELEGITAAGDAEEARLEREAEEEARLVLETLGPDNLSRNLDELDNTAPASEVDQAREALHVTSGNRQAAAAARVVKDGARGTVWSHGERDKRYLGYARISTSGTPCGWCAMLISRGAVYRSAKSATATFDDGDKYHDNCYCVAVPIFSREQYAGPEFALNRRYSELWPQVTRGLSGKAAVSAWRRFIRAEQAAQRRARPGGDAPRTPNVQEA
ncbi:hypothetical protein RHODO2019_10860 [Rhodococcus antarcticus]|uniref:Capsid maturation protease n=1 Tax=Rhodococcus antarcticus TaxID=2987751 RepID=A0ABY6NXQ3_9NOCA|nr:hypothetical protein [Rhodococcus antarcticus]UZJ23708.1 hypothetical protein RHODO2019_10860 [Rhodococcus antarcticus]